MEHNTLLQYNILLQLLPSFIFAVVGAFLSVFFAKMLKQNGRVLKKLEEGFGRMEEGFRRMDEGFRRMDERAEQRHMEVVELLKKMTELISKGFRDLSRDI